MESGEFWNSGSDLAETQILETCLGATPHAKYGYWLRLAARTIDVTKNVKNVKKRDKNKKRL